MHDFQERMKRAERELGDERAVAAAAKQRIDDYLAYIHQRLSNSIRELEKQYDCTVSTAPPVSGPYTGAVRVSFPIDREKRIFRKERVVGIYEIRVLYTAYELRHPPEHPPELARQFATMFGFDWDIAKFRPDGSRMSGSGPMSLDPQGGFKSDSIDDALDYFAKCVVAALEQFGERIRIR